MRLCSNARERSVVGQVVLATSPVRFERESCELRMGGDEGPLGTAGGGHNKKWGLSV